MAECTECGKQMGFQDKMHTLSNGGKCQDCTRKSIDARYEKQQQEYKRQQQEAADEKQDLEVTQIAAQELKNFGNSVAGMKVIDAIMLTTETVPNLNIKSRVGIIMADADCSFTVQMVENNNALQSKLRSEAHSIGANAVVGITFNMIETYSATLGVSKVNTFKLIAYGTAVVIED